MFCGGFRGNDNDFLDGFSFSFGVLFGVLGFDVMVVLKRNYYSCLGLWIGIYFWGGFGFWVLGFGGY